MPRAGVALLRPLLALALVAVCAAPAAAQRVSLVVGVAAYKAVTPLGNPGNDARGIAAALGRLGFDVDLVLDPDRAAMEAAVRRLRQKARGAEAALFYFAGHALEAGGRNWLVPTTAEIRSDRDLPFETMSLDLILEQLDGVARLTLVLLDACRDNPFRLQLRTASRSVGDGGLSPVRAAVGTLIAFATAPGTVADDGDGQNSPFTAALLRRIETPGLEIRQLLAEVRRDVRERTRDHQIPWEHSALEGSFYFRPVAQAPPGPGAPSPEGAPRESSRAELLFWESIRNSRDPADLRAYLDAFPRGVFAGLARNRLTQLQQDSAAAAAPQPSAPAALAERIQEAFSPFISPLPTRAEFGRGFSRLPLHRAIAAAPRSHASWRTGANESAESAADLTLEQCQIRYGEPCALVALDESVHSAGPKRQLPVREMARVRYSGRFDPGKIPGISASRARMEDIAGYASARGAKAMALHPSFASQQIFVASGAATQREAEDIALRACNEDPKRAGADGPCFLYSSGMQVVLPQRRMSTGPQFTETSLAATLTNLPETERSQEARRYWGGPPHKSLAVVPGRRGARWINFAFNTAADAEELTLERCQMFFAAPCALVAINDARRAESGRPLQARDMPRLRYAGRFDPQQVAGLSPYSRGLPEFRGYGSAPEPKAMAIHPWGRFFVVTGAPSQHAAERQALAACNSDPDRAGRDGPCFLYATGMQVILPERRTAPVAPPPRP